MSFNLNPPQWEPKINRPQATNNNGRGSGGGGDYAGGGYRQEEVNTKNSDMDIFEEEVLVEEKDIDVNFTTFLRFVYSKIVEFFKKKKD